MFRQMIAISVAACTLFAGQYATLKNGKTIILHENGSWEEVAIDKTVAATKDGTIKHTVSSPVASSPMAAMIIGEWRSSDDSIYYLFGSDGSVKYSFNDKSSTAKYTIESFDAKSRVMSVNIGESSRIGILSFGGYIRKLRLSEDGKSAVDISDEASMLATTTLIKTANTQQQPISKAKEPSEIVSEAGFVK